MVHVRATLSGKTVSVRCAIQRACAGSLAVGRTQDPSPSLVEENEADRIVDERGVRMAGRLRDPLNELICEQSCFAVCLRQCVKDGELSERVGELLDVDKGAVCSGLGISSAHCRVRSSGHTVFARIKFCGEDSESLDCRVCGCRRGDRRLVCRDESTDGIDESASAVVSHPGRGQQRARTGERAGDCRGRARGGSSADQLARVRVSSREGKTGGERAGRRGCGCERCVGLRGRQIGQLEVFG